MGACALKGRGAEQEDDEDEEEEAAERPAPMALKGRHRENTHILLNTYDDTDGNTAEQKQRSATMQQRVEADFLISQTEDYAVSDARKGRFTTTVFAGYNLIARKTCQDTVLSVPVRSRHCNYHLFCVFDGHGQYGDRVSKRASVLMQESFANRIKDLHDSPENVEKAFRRAFDDVDEGLRKEMMFVTLSGSTATCVLLCESRVDVAFVGDSRAAVCITEGRRLNVEQLSRCHNFSDAKERRRAEKAGAIIRQARTSDGTEVGPLRLYDANFHGPGLAVSRSFGDAMGAKLGVTHKPEFRSFPLSEHAAFFVVASDGVWDMMSPEEVCRFVVRHQEDAKVGERLVRRCVGRWVDANEGICDDISATIVFLRRTEVDDAGDSDEDEKLDRAAKRRLSGEDLGRTAAAVATRVGGTSMRNLHAAAAAAAEEDESESEAEVGRAGADEVDSDEELSQDTPKGKAAPLQPAASASSSDASSSMAPSSSEGGSAAAASSEPDKREEVAQADDDDTLVVHAEALPPASPLWARGSGSSEASSSAAAAPSPPPQAASPQPDGLIEPAEPLPPMQLPPASGDAAEVKAPSPTPAAAAAAAAAAALSPRESLPADSLAPLVERAAAMATFSSPRVDEAPQPAPADAAPDEQDASRV